MRLAVLLFCLLLGTTFPLLLNGQTFNNSLLGLGFALTALALTVTGTASTRSAAIERGLPRIIAALAVLLAAFLLAQLPTAYHYQTNFNRRSAQLRQAAATATSREELLKATTAIATQKAQPSQANQP